MAAARLPALAMLFAFAAAPLAATGARGAELTARACLTAGTRALLTAGEARFGVRFTLVSTCRPGAVIAGTQRASQHRYGRAFDLIVPAGVSKAAVVGWFFARTRGVVMTYAGMPHVHVDTGPFHKLVTPGGGEGSRLSARRRQDARR